MYCKEALKNKVFELVSKVSKETSIKSYVVGGFVRDFLLNIDNDDIDIVVEGSGIEFAKYFSEKVNGKLSFYENYGTAMVKFDDTEVEFVGARKETYERGSRNPIVENGTLHDDISRRDFTINALAISLNEENYGELLDFFNGLDDLNKKIIRTPLNPDITFSDDPLRMFRAVRFVSKLKNFNISNETKEGIKNNLHRIPILTRERITSEIEKMLSYTYGENGFILMNELGLWDYAFPDNEFSMLNINSAFLSSKIECKWFFLSLNYKNDNKTFVKTMKLPNEICNYLDKINLTFMLFSKLDYPSLPIVRRCLCESGKYAFIGLECVFNYHLIKEEYDKQIIADWFFSTKNVFYDEIEFIDYKTLPYNGNEISKMSGIPEGKLLGLLMNEIKNKILNGELKNTKNSVYAYIRYKNFQKNKKL